MANLEAFRKRMVQRLTSPPEILYALTRHWVLMTCLVSFGILIMAAKVSTDLPLYEAKATLLLSGDESDLVEKANSVDPREQDPQKAFTSWVSHLTRDAVLRRLVQVVNPIDLMAQDANPEEGNYGTVRQLISKFKKKAVAFFEHLEHPRVQDIGEEYEIQRAVAAFKRRSRVTPDPRTSTVKIQVFGTDREGLENELDKWIRVYTATLVELSRESRVLFFNSMREQYTASEESARKDLEAFRNASPAVSKLAHDSLLQQIKVLEERRQRLALAIEEGETEPEEKPETDPEILALIEQQRKLETARDDLLRTYQPESLKVRPLNEQLRQLAEKIEQMKAARPGFTHSEKATPEERMQKAVQALEAATEQQRVLASKLEEHRRLEEALAEQTGRRKQYEEKNIVEGDRGPWTKYVQAQVLEKPQASWTPYETYPYRQVLYGALAGLALGTFFALLRELLRSTIHLKSDIEAEFPVRVVGVIPLR
jgi:uncharacterized protein involved in exopolysaccharide biosynthesis